MTVRDVKETLAAEALMMLRQGTTRVESGQEPPTDWSLLRQETERRSVKSAWVDPVSKEIMIMYDTPADSDDLPAPLLPCLLYTSDAADE